MNALIGRRMDMGQDVIDPNIVFNIIYIMRTNVSKHEIIMSALD